MATSLTLWKFIRPGYTPMDPPKRIQKRLGKIYRIVNAIKENK